MPTYPLGSSAATMRLRKAAAGTIAGLLFAPAAHGQQIDTARALAGLRDALTVCRADGGALWNHDLCGPIALADRQTRMALLNDSVPRRHYLRLADAFVTALPDNQFVANTSFPWSGREWTMVSLPLPADRYSRVALVMHEVFHREQKAIGLGALDALNNHLDFRAGRTWLRLEYRALGSALRSTDDAEARRHAADAMLFRAMRRSLYPGADSTEALLEIQEGLAEYTGQRLAMQLTGAGPERVAQYLQEFDRNTPTFVRAFAYGTGPAIGTLLDRFDPRWRDDIQTRRDLSGLLIQAIEFVPPARLADEAQRRAQSYEWAKIDASEAAQISPRHDHEWLSRQIRRRSHDRSPSSQGFVDLGLRSDGAHRVRPAESHLSVRQLRRAVGTTPGRLECRSGRERLFDHSRFGATWHGAGRDEWNDPRRWLATSAESGVAPGRGSAATRQLHRGAPCPVRCELLNQTPARSPDRSRSDSRELLGTHDDAGAHLSGAQDRANRDQKRRDGHGEQHSRIHADVTRRNLEDEPDPQLARQLQRTLGSSRYKPGTWVTE